MDRIEKIKKKILLIVNPCSGKTKTRISSTDIMKQFPEDEYEFTMKATTCQGDATNIVKNELKDNDMVVCCGGDGTLNEVINGMLRGEVTVPLGYIPCGSTNDFANSMGLSVNIKQAASAVANDILSILKDGKASFAPVFTAAKEGDVVPSEKFACRRYVRTDIAESELCALLGKVTDLGGAYITDAAFTEAEFDRLLGSLGNASTLRVL